MIDYNNFFKLEKTYDMIQSWFDIYRLIYTVVLQLTSAPTYEKLEIRASFQARFSTNIRAMFEIQALESVAKYAGGVL